MEQGPADAPTRPSTVSGAVRTRSTTLFQLGASRLVNVARRFRRAVFVRRIQLLAASVGSTVDLDAALDLHLGRHIRIEIAPGTHNELHIGTGCRVRDGVAILLDGGRIRIGPWSDIRRGVVLNVSGTLDMAGGNILSWGTTVHCAGRISLGRFVAAGEHVSLVDSTHYHSSEERAVHRNVKTGTIEIGENTWLGAKATVIRNSRVGASCTVAANSLVRGEVPDGHLAIGVPVTVRARESREHGPG